MPDLREALQAAMAQQENEEDPKEEVVQPEVQATEEVKVEDAPGTGDQSEDRQEDTTPEQAAESEETKADSPKFLPPEEEGTKEEEPKVAEAPRDDDPTPGPTAWRAVAKRHWKELPSEVRQEVTRREREMNRGLRESADARKFHGEFEQAVQPFRPLIAAAGVDEITATRNLWQMAAGLQMGNPQQKAQIVAQIINQNAVDLGTLDSLLAGQGASESGNGAGVDPGLAQVLQRELAPVKQFMGTLQQAQESRQQQTAQSAEKEIETFAADPENIFFEDVREDMADMLELASQRGRTLSLKDAYDRAVAMRDDLAQVVQHQQGRQASVETAQTLQRKKRAASSVQGIPTQPSNAKPVDMRGQLAEAWDAQSGDRH